MKTAIQQDPWALEYASPKLKDNFNLVRHAALKDSLALIFASKRLLLNKNLLIIACEIEEEEFIHEILSDTLKDDTEKVDLIWEFLFKADLGIP
jgi:hypothetical protein